MFSLLESEQDKTYTIFRIKGKQKKPLENKGIAVGCDITLLSFADDGSALVKLANGLEKNLSPEQADAIMIDRQWIRKSSDPVFLGGCCAYGNTAEVWDKYVNGNAPGDVSEE